MSMNLQMGMKLFAVSKVYLYLEGKARLQLARALIKKPGILILDDTMSALDSETEKNILTNLKENFSGLTLLIASHRIVQVKDLDYIIVLEDGKIVEEGDSDALMANKAWYYKQYQIQSMEE